MGTIVGGAVVVILVVGVSICSGGTRDSGGTEIVVVMALQN